MEVKSDKEPVKQMKKTLAIVLLIFLLNVRSIHSLSNVSGRQFVEGVKRPYPACAGRETVTQVINLFGNETTFSYTIPKDHCLVCYQPNCVGDDCQVSDTFRKPLEENYLEFGVYSSNLPETNGFEIKMNEKCVFNLSATPTDNFTTIRVVLDECIITGDEPVCTEIYSLDKTDFAVNKSCVLVKLGFYDPTKVHYKILFECFNYSSDLLDSLVTDELLEIRSEDCYFNKETYMPSIQYNYLDSNTLFPYAIILTMPCSEEGLPLLAQILTVRPSEDCEEVVKKEIRVRGFTYIVETINELARDLPLDKASLNDSSSMYPAYLFQERSAHNPFQMKAAADEEGDEDDKCKFEEPDVREAITEEAVGDALATAAPGMGGLPPLENLNAPASLEPAVEAGPIPLVANAENMDSMGDGFTTESAIETRDGISSESAGMGAGDASGASILAASDFQHPLIFFTLYITMKFMI